jgi:hemerythrin-like metal-binding protein
MSFLKTSEECLLGAKKFDVEHMREVAIVNLLHNAIRGGATEAEARPLVDGLLQQTHLRFIEEEYLMRRLGCAGYRQHRTDHHRIARILSRNWATINLNCSDGRAGALRLMSYGAQLMRHHMMTEDQAVAAFLADQAKAPAES